MQTETFTQRIKFDSSPHEIYELIMDSEKHSAFTGSKCELSKEVGGKFECYDGYIKGENIELIPDKKIVQTWIGKDFPEGTSSTVTFEFSEDNSKTILNFKHEGVPSVKAEHLKHGWNKMYWDKIKEYLSNQ